MTFIPSVYRDPNAVVGGRSFGKKTFVNRHEVEPIELHDFFTPRLYNRLFRDPGFSVKKRHFLTMGELKNIYT